MDEQGTIETDIAVVGGGLAGLAAATTAARSGEQVVLLDAHGGGGRARTLERDGFRLNDGGHALYRRGAGMRVLGELGVTVTGAAPPIDRYQLVWNGELVPFPASGRGLMASRLFGPRAKLAAGRLLATLDGEHRDANGRSFGEWLDRQRVGADLRKYLLALAQVSTYAASPADWAAPAVVAQLARASGGVLYVDGGWGRIVSALRSAAERSGASVRTSRQVTSVASDGARWVVHAADGSRVVAHAVVIAAGGPRLAGELLGSDPAEWVERAGPASRAACLDLGFDHVPAATFVKSADEPLYLSLHAPTAQLAPDGCALYSLMRYLAPGDPFSADENRAALRRHASTSGLPATAALERFLAAPVVSWGSPVAGLQRPTGFELADRGLFAAGDWVGDHLLADAALASGAAAGRAAAARRVTVST